MAGNAARRTEKTSRRKGQKLVLIWIALALVIITPGSANALGGFSVMSTVPLSIANVMKDRPRQSANSPGKTGPLAAVGVKTFQNALYDPLTRESAEENAKKSSSLTARHANGQNANPAVGQGVDTLQTKAASLMTKLGFIESGKTHELRQPINKNQVQSPYVSLDKAVGRVVEEQRAEFSPKPSEPAPAMASEPKPAQTLPSTKPQATPKVQQPAQQRQPAAQPVIKPHAPAQLAQASQTAPEAMPQTAAAQAAPAQAQPMQYGPAPTPPAQQTAIQPHAPMQARSNLAAQLNAVGTPSEAAGPQVRMPVSKQGPTAVSGPSAVAVRNAPPSEQLPYVAPAGNSVRMPVQNVSRNSVVLDLEAETRARQMLTEEVKKALLPVTGELSAVFESGKEGVAAIGYDRMGGTSYGKYQIASRTGMMQLFMKYLDEQEPTWSNRLRQSGPANTSSRWGGMPSEWKKIAAENPKRFESLQDDFIMRTNYEPAANNIEARTALNVEGFSPALKEVLLSTAVQHGPNGAARIFANAANAAGRPADPGQTDLDSQDFDKRFIEEVYRVRKLNFQSSTPQVRNAVKSRLTLEQQMAITLLDEQGVKDIL